MEQDQETPARAKRAPERDFGGEWVEIGDEFFKVAPMSFGRLKVVIPLLTDMRTKVGVQTDAMDTMIQVVHIAVSRNYPGITSEEIGDKLDIRNAQEVVTRIVEISGMKRGEPEGGKTPSP